MAFLPGIPVTSPAAAPPVSLRPVTDPLGNAKANLGNAKSVSAAKQADSGTATRVVEQELGRDAFLQLLVLQLRNQDPLDPQSNESMLAQLAQFSALEQQTNLNDNFELLSGNIDQLNFISASQLLGQRVSGIDVNGDPREGVVERIQLDGSLVVLTVDGELMTMAGVLEIDEGGDIPKPQEGK